MGFQGPRYTWTNGRKGLANIRQRLDRIWCNLLWHHCFEDDFVKYLPQVCSDHHPILLCTKQVTQRQNFKRFHFLDAWFQHPDFMLTIEQIWNKEPGGLEKKLAEFKSELMEWNITFSVIFLRAKNGAMRDSSRYRKPWQRNTNHP